METNVKLTIGTIITLAVLFSGTYIISQDDTAYYCESKDMVMLCDKLSSGLGSRCYYLNTYKICREGWEEIEGGQEIELGESNQLDGPRWSCSPEKCIEIA